MKRNLFKSNLVLVISLIAILGIGMSSCGEELDKSNLYTFTGETMEGFFISRSGQFSDFNYILKRSGLNRILSAYGSYTCFAPTNDAVEKYIDSLYNDKENKEIPHNGMTENSLEGLSDSLCKDIAKYHVCNGEYNAVDMIGNGITLATMLGRDIITSVNTSGKTTLNETAEIISENNSVTNGLVHVVNSVIPRSNRLVPSELNRHSQFSIFSEALQRTGLADSLIYTVKKATFINPPEETSYYVYEGKCKEAYTVFAESDDVLKNNGIKSFDDLVAYANQTYGKCAEGGTATENAGWYDYYRDNNIRVSTSNDYTARNNALNMFVAYHLLKFALPKDKITIDWNVWNGNGYNGDTYEYYETMLPKTLMKVWKVKTLGTTFINRYKTLNTLTDGVETMGSDAMHVVENEGAIIKADSVIQALNGYVYPVTEMLVYNYDVPQKVLHERMRMDTFSFLPEVMNNGFRSIDRVSMTALNGGIPASWMRFPYNFFNTVKVYNGNNTTLDMAVRNVHNANTYLVYLGDGFQGKGQYDFAIKLPPVPDGLYEFRVSADCMKHGSMLQFYIGERPNRGEMEPISIPMDMRMDSDDPRISWSDPTLETDKGIETDKVLRNRGYMRGPLSITKEDQNFVSRYKFYQLRRILIRMNFKQHDYWLRMKTVLPDVSNGKFQLDYVEFVPVNVCDNEQYLEDMY